MRNAGQILSQTQLLDLVWGYDFDGASNVVETYVRHLRRKIGADRIETVRRAGYRMVDR
jgi:DNA-binding response OmpR family regulator